ncbi:uncharacterized protein LOC119997700 [Tripterygium wilfordii]|uniref:uncharacterized protein LOC119997700 n=1 Tax=Tripterygium wilfordii TaxID=458696 RepID=UPI0018F7FE9F|nr:uncharacterized protein LOC119997700 [Tripterygium wilfordii]
MHNTYNTDLIVDFSITKAKRMAMVSECHSPSSLKDKLKLSICCFRGDPHELLDNDGDRQRTPEKSLQSGDPEFDMRDRFRGLIGRSGKNRRRFNSSDFRYDPTSYALNFEDESRVDELPLTNFLSKYR